MTTLSPTLTSGLCAFIVTLLFLSPETMAQKSTYEKDGKRVTVTWESMEGQVVTVDAVATGAGEKGLGQRIELDGRSIFVSGVDFHDAKINDKLVRITGVFTEEHMPAATGLVQGYSEAFDYLNIKAFSAKEIEKSEQEQVIPSDADWVHAGMKTSTAKRLLKRRKLVAIDLEMKEPEDGSKIHAHRIDEKKALLLRVKNGRIVRVATIAINHGEVAGRVEDIGGYELKSDE